MKKRTKITLRTKIYLTIVGLLALAGVLYASNPTPFSGQVPFPTSVVAAPDLLFVGEYCGENIFTLDCNGNASVFATLPGNGSCQEKYMAIAPSQSLAAGFTPRDVFATEGNNVYNISTGSAMLFTPIMGCTASDHNGITFDHTGNFGFDMIVTCNEGAVFKIDNLPGGPHVTQIASLNRQIEGPAVVPIGFGPQGGQIWVAAEDDNAVHAIKNDGTVTLNIISHVTAEAVGVIPNPPCTFRPASPPGCPSPGFAFFQTEQQQNQLVWGYPLTDFTVPPIGGNVILTSESGADFADTSLVQVSGGAYVQSSFGPRIPGINEGSSFVDCDVPIASPTPTPTATFTPTATATFTPTATATFTPTATATFTPTATATFTPTPTATSTPTPTPTPPGVGCQESTSISGGFNAFAIAPGNYLWFSGVLKAKNLPTNAAVNITFTNQTVTIPGIGSVPVPDATVTFDPNANFATTNFAGTWMTTVPSNPTLKGNTFFSGLSLQLPGGLPGSARPVTWSGTISIDTPGVSVNWQWAAANYPTFSNNYNALGVKPVDDKVQNPYLNADHAGTPENFKQFVVGGGTGGGASNYTGSLSSTASVCR